MTILLTAAGGLLGAREVMRTIGGDRFLLVSRLRLQLPERLVGTTRSGYYSKLAVSEERINWSMLRSGRRTALRTCQERGRAWRAANSEVADGAYPGRPRNPYETGKACDKDQLREFVKRADMDFVTLQFSNVVAALDTRPVLLSWLLSSIRCGRIAGLWAYAQSVLRSVLP